MWLKALFTVCVGPLPTFRAVFLRASTIAWSNFYRKTHQVWQPASTTIQQLKGDVVFVVRLTIDLSVASISSFLSGVLSDLASAILVKHFFLKMQHRIPLAKGLFFHQGSSVSFMRILYPAYFCLSPIHPNLFYWLSFQCSFIVNPIHQRLHCFQTLVHVEISVEFDLWPPEIMIVVFNQELLLLLITISGDHSTIS